jgi:hypothetical protein
MRRFVVTKNFIAGPVVLALTVLLPGPADAQVVGPRVGTQLPAPTISPYINLLRSPNAPTLNYFGLVRPQFQTNAGLQTLQQQLLLGQTGPLTGAEPTGDVLTTGHAAMFMNYGGYFQSQTGALRSPATTVPAPTLSRPTGAAVGSGRLPRPGPQ